MKRPSFQFYPGDWRANAKLRRCTHAERGIWLEVLCLMHDAEEYGVLRWPLAEIAAAVGCRPADLRALQRKGVLKGADVGETVEAFVFVPRHANRDGTPETLIDRQPGPLWYSSRMVRDEHVRAKRGMGSRFGAQPMPEPKPPIGYGSSSSSSSSTSPISPPSGGNGGSHKPKRSRDLSAVPDDFEVSDDMAQWAVNLGVQPDALKAQTEKFLDHHRAKGSRFRDWPAAWRTWMRNAVEFARPGRH